jgi:uncharacterized protein DUF6916
MRLGARSVHRAPCLFYSIIVRSCVGMLDTLSATIFSPRLYEPFTLSDGSARLDLELVEVTELGATTPERRTPFSIVFRGPDRPTLPQRIYRLEHAELGAFELFLVPIGPGEYEAVFT